MLAGFHEYGILYIMKKFPHIQIYPSILAGDFGHLAEEAKRLEDAGADGIHIDIMDGHFVPNLTLGPKAIAAINRATRLFLDVHIMIYNPYDFIERLIEVGADQITFHFEASETVEETLEYIRKCNVKAGLAFCPETSFSMIPKFLSKCDMILLMTVHPGFGGQKFIPDVLEKIRLTRELCNKLGIRKNGVLGDESLPPFDIQVDGGIEPPTAKKAIEAGANVLVAGTYVFQQKQVKDGIDSLRQCHLNRN
jgi:ribulose-phosphate 3-epimerase